MVLSGAKHFFTVKSPRAPSFEENGKSLFPCLPWRLGGENFLMIQKVEPPSSGVSLRIPGGGKGERSSPKYATLKLLLDRYRQGNSIF
jgi:hypothetical protein